MGIDLLDIQMNNQVFVGKEFVERVFILALKDFHLSALSSAKETPLGYNQ